MQSNKKDFAELAAQMLRELAAKAIILELMTLAYLLTMAAQEAAETHAKKAI
jgi:hypothetical protein